LLEADQALLACPLSPLRTARKTVTCPRIIGYDLSAEQVALIYKLRWDVESFFAWWKRHLNVYHLFARSENGLMVQILSGLITYLLLAIYCHEQHGETVSIQRVRQLRTQIRNEALQQAAEKAVAQKEKRKSRPRYRKRLKRPHAIS